VVTKIPRFTFEKFPTADPVLTTSDEIVGEAMAIGRTFKESLQKCLRSLETGRWGFGFDSARTPKKTTEEEITRKLQIPNAERIFWLQTAFTHGWSIEKSTSATQIDPWFLRHLKQIADEGRNLAPEAREETRDLRPPAPAPRPSSASPRRPRSPCAKEPWPTSRPRTRSVRAAPQKAPRHHPDLPPGRHLRRRVRGLHAVFLLDLRRRERGPPERPKKIIILGGGPNRIGQGIEFDYCCVHAAFAAAELGYETIMVNSNPETVSTDYDTSDKLYFEPLTLEDVLNICEQENRTA
jgi:carbamoyl-phosphate synthase large subunit